MADDTGAPGRPLCLGDAVRLAEAFGTHAFAPAEHCFANLWLFRERHAYRLVDGPVPYVRGVTYDGVVHALPLVLPDAAGLRALALSGVDCLYPMTGSSIAALAPPDGLPVRHDPSDSDYWYEGAAIATLSGAKQRRSQARRFAADEAPSWESWSARLTGEALDVLDGWAADVARPIDATDLRECREAIEHAATLGLEGGVVRTGVGKVVAFLLASRAGNARVIHFAKGRRAASDAYPWMFSTYATQSGAAWLNFEQDLGKPGLAQSKRAYAPMRIEPKLRLGLAPLR